MKDDLFTTKTKIIKGDFVQHIFFKGDLIAQTKPLTKEEFENFKKAFLNFRKSISKINHMNQKKCIFCGSNKLSREHIYPKWLFDLFRPTEKTFKPSFHIVELSKTNDVTDKFSGNISDGRQINYDDFTVKRVCIECNSGWMSNLEGKVRPLFAGFFNSNQPNIEVNSDDALILSQWVVLKLMLTSLTLPNKIFFSDMQYKLLKNGIIPEGFIVEVAEMQYEQLNYMIGGPTVRKSFEINRELLDKALRNFYKASLQIGKVAFRVSYLRTEIPVFRKQLHQRLFVLFPYKSILPFEKSELEVVDYGIKLELPILNSRLAIHD